MATGGDETGQVLPGAGWFPDAANPDRERLWTGERWIDWIRPARADRVEANPAAWHPDPQHPGFERLWGGEMWTEEIRRAVPAGAPVAASGVPVQPHPQQGAAAAARPAGVSLESTVTYHDSHPPDRLGGLGTWVGIALGAVVAATLAELITDQLYIGVQTDILDRRPTSIAHIESVVGALHTAHWIAFAVQSIASIIFVFWFYRAYRNLVRAGIGDLRFGPGWAIGGWFIPIFSLIRQKQIANDIWKASASAGTIGLARRREIALPGALNWWWGSWILGGLLVLLASRDVAKANAGTIFTNSSLHTERTGVWTMQIGLVVLIAAAVLAYLFVRDVSRMQDENFEAVAPGTGSAVPSQPWALAQTASVDGAAQTGVATPTKTCPQCAEQVKAEALVCRFCGHRFDAAG